MTVYWERDGAEYFAGSATTDGSGAARLTELPRGTRAAAREREGIRPRLGAAVLGAEPAKTRLTLDAEATLSVRVTDEQGAPIARATVLVTAGDPLPFGALTGREARSRSDVCRRRPGR